MIDILGASLNVLDFSGWTAFTVLCWLTIKGYKDGRTYPAVFVDQIREDRDQRLVEVGAWKQAWEARGETIAALMAQNTKLLELSETSAHILKSLPSPGDVQEEVHRG